jgi:hypothetical protein
MTPQISSDEAVVVAREYAASRGWVLSEPTRVQSLGSDPVDYEVEFESPAPGLSGAVFVVSGHGKICQHLLPRTPFTRNFQSAVAVGLVVASFVALMILPGVILVAIFALIFWLRS